MSVFPIIALLIIIAVVLLKQIDQFERGIMLTMGKYSGMKEPGWRIVIPVFQRMIKVDTRIKAVDVPDQNVITRDNVSVGVNAVIYYRVMNPELAVLKVENFFFAVSQLAQTTMRNVVGEVELDQLLTERDSLSERIRTIVDQATDGWGVKVENVELKDISLPGDMARTIAKQAEAERERRAVVIKAEGEVDAAENMAKAARTLASQNGALHLRTLQSLNDLSSDQSNTVIFAIPLEILRAFEGMGNQK